jgi:hypothetical protein
MKKLKVFPSSFMNMKVIIFIVFGSILGNICGGFFVFSFECPSLILMQPPSHLFQLRALVTIVEVVSQNGGISEIYAPR